MQAATETPDLIAERLAEYGAATRAALDTWLPQNRASFLDALMADYPRRGGKMMRPCLCIAHARAFGGTLADALPCAAAVEILHNGLLIHDDIQDESELRRGEPTLHRLHGIPLAINAGDALMLAALAPLFESLRGLGISAGEKILAATQTMARETAQGQALELGWRGRRGAEVTEADYLTLVLKKTAWLATIWPAQLGLLVGSRGSADPQSVIRFGFFLGAAFQIEDDLRNLENDSAYGKERYGDLLEAKQTLMMIHVRRSCSGAERRRLDDFLARPRGQRDPDEAVWLAGLMRDHGSIDQARRTAGAMAGAALHEFDVAYGHLPDSADKRFIAGLAPWVIMRR
jgi:geranylgeranyl diphosphate synthase type II